MASTDDKQRVIEALIRLGGPPRGGKYRCPKPDHEDKNPSTSVFTLKNGRTGWKCFACQAFGDLANLLELEGYGRKAALEEIGFEFDNDNSPPPRRHSKPARRKPRTPVSAHPRSGGQTASRVRNRTFAEWSEGVLLRKPDCQANGVDTPPLDRTPTSEVLRQLYERWASTWPGSVVLPRTQPASRPWKVEETGGGGEQVRSKTVHLPVARVPLFDLQRRPSGWADRNLNKTSTSSTPKWLYSKHCGIKAVGLHRLGNGDPRDNFWEPPTDIWLVEGHSDWITGLCAAERAIGKIVAVIGVHGIGSMPAVAEDLAELVAEKRADTKLVIVADCDDAALGGSNRSNIHRAADVWHNATRLGGNRNRVTILAPDPEQVGTPKPDFTDFWRAACEEETSMADAQSKVYDVVSRVARTSHDFGGMRCVQ